nr:hypothetical protein Iba_chr08eCG7240 [Ipomoea batatas]
MGGRPVPCILAGELGQLSTPSFFRHLAMPRYLPILITLALQFPSSKTFVDLTSRCKILGAAASCRYSSPRAAPRAIATRAFHSKNLPEAPSRQSRRLPLGMYSNTSSLRERFPWRSEQ